VDAEGPAGVPEGRGCFPDNYPACQAGKEWPKAAQPSRGCLVELFRRPEPIVRSRTSLKSIEVSYLNMPERIPKHKTPPKCADTDEWMKDPIGRPIQASTALLLQRALEVGHPHNGIMDPSYRLPARSCTKPVPRIMHFVWFCKPLPDRVAKRVIDFAIMNPSWRIMILVDVALNAEEAKLLSAPEVVNRPGGAIIVHFLASYTDEFRNMDILRHIRDRSHDPRHLHVCAGMSDVARLEVLHTYGGIYMDSDFIPNRPWDDYGDMFRWPFVSHKVCGVNIINSIMGFDRRSGFLDFALDAFRENCLGFRNCMPEGGAGPPFIAMAILRYNSSDIGLIGQQFFHDSKKQVVSHLTENSWGQR